MTRESTALIYLFIGLFFGAITVASVGAMESEDPQPVYVWEPNRQFIIDEVCVNYLCRKVTATAAINDKVFYLTANGKTLEVLVEKITILHDHYFFTFEHQRGFFSIGIYDKVAFVYLDKENIILHIDKSSLNQRDK